MQPSIKIAIGGGLIIALAVGIIFLNKEIKCERFKSNWQTRQDLFVVKTETLPPFLQIAPAKFPNRGGQLSLSNSNYFNAIGYGCSIEDIFKTAYAYDSKDGQVPKWRIALLVPEPKEKYDYIVTLPSGGREALKQEIKKQFGVVGVFETIETNVLVLKLKNSQSTALNPGTVPAYDSKKSYLVTLTMPKLAKELEDGYFYKPVFNEAGTNGTIYSFALPRDSSDLDLLKRNLEQSNLEIVSGQRPVEMLIVKKAN